MKIHDNYLTFKDVLIKPLVSIIPSRYDSRISIKTKFTKNVEIDIPLVSSNMDTVTGYEMCNEMDKLGGIGVLHRHYINNDEWINEILKISAKKWAMSVGYDWDNILNRLYYSEECQNNITNYPDVIVFDVAYCANEKIIDSIKQLINFRKTLRLNICEGKTSKFVKIFDIMVGNIATYDAANELKKLDIDGIKIGIGNGNSCLTRKITGVGVPQLSAISEISAVIKKSNIPICSDGGITEPSDCNKALAAGASSVMIGALFAYAEESCKKWKIDNGCGYGVFDKETKKPIYRKEYIGMSSYAQNRTKEGTTQYLKWNGELPKLEWIINPFIGGLRSCLAYTNSFNISQLQENVEFIKCSYDTFRENSNDIIKPIIQK